MSWPTFVCAESYSMAALFVAKLTPADVTPVAPASASCTVEAKLAQVIPSIGSTMRVLLMGGGRHRGTCLGTSRRAADLAAHPREVASACTSHSGRDIQRVAPE